MNSPFIGRAHHILMRLKTNRRQVLKLRSGGRLAQHYISLWTVNKAKKGRYQLCQRPLQLLGVCPPYEAIPHVSERTQAHSTIPLDSCHLPGPVNTSLALWAAARTARTIATRPLVPAMTPTGLGWLPTRLKSLAPFICWKWEKKNQVPSDGHKSVTLFQFQVLWCQDHHSQWWMWPAIKWPMSSSASLWAISSSS